VGTILHPAAGDLLLHVTWVVLAAVREREAVSSAAAFLKDVEQTTVVLRAFRDGFFPWAGAEVKEVFEDLKGSVTPDLVIVPRRDDAHQDHRLVAELTWNTLRGHLVLEYEIPQLRR
jgi:LmbE family N-acetylglucosaminyl deacetylase